MAASRASSTRAKQQELERMNRLRVDCAAAVPVRGAHQGQGRKKESGQPNAPAPTENVPAEGLGREPPECSCQAGGTRLGAKWPYKGTKGRKGSTSLTSPHPPPRGWRERQEEVMLSLDC